MLFAVRPPRKGSYDIVMLSGDVIGGIDLSYSLLRAKSVTPFIAHEHIYDTSMPSSVALEGVTLLCSREGMTLNHCVCMICAYCLFSLYLCLSLSLHPRLTHSLGAGRL